MYDIRPLSARARAVLAVARQIDFTVFCLPRVVASSSGCRVDPSTRVVPPPVWLWLVGAIP